MQLDNVVTKSSSHDIADGVGSDDGSSVQSHSTFSDPEFMGKHKEWEPFCFLEELRFWCLVSGQVLVLQTCVANVVSGQP